MRDPTIDWRDGAAYARLLDADRSLFAWEWLRRDPAYRMAAETGRARGNAQGAARFGLVAFEAPGRSIPDARPLWCFEASAHVLRVAPVRPASPFDEWRLESMEALATRIESGCGAHLLLCDGFRTVRLDGPPGAFSSGPTGFRYRIAGLASARPQLGTLTQFLSLCRTGRFLRRHHPRETRARRWILMLRTWDALAVGADQRAIAQMLLRGSVAEPRWRTREASVRSQVQRLVRAARAAAGGGYRLLLD